MTGVQTCALPISLPGLTDRRTGCRRQLRHHQTGWHRWFGHSRHRHRPAALRGRRAGLRQPRRRRALRHSHGDPAGRRASPGQRHPRFGTAGGSEGVDELHRRLPQHHQRIVLMVLPYLLHKVSTERRDQHLLAARRQLSLKVFTVMDMVREISVTNSCSLQQN